MNMTKLLLIFVTLGFSNYALAYGGSGVTNKKACNKPGLSKFTPAHLTVVAAETNFSFLASATTNPSSIEVKVKKQAVDITINKIQSGYSVSGKLPASLQNTYARIEITATGTNNCQGNGGWLLKIEEPAPEAP